MHSSRMRTARSSSCLLEGVCLSACWDAHNTQPPPGCGPEDPPARPLNLPPGCGPGDPPPDPSTSPLGVGLETPQVWAWRPPQPDP